VYLARRAKCTDWRKLNNTRIVFRRDSCQAVIKITKAWITSLARFLLLIFATNRQSRKPVRFVTVDRLRKG